MGARLVRHDVDVGAAPDQLRQHLGGVAEQADGERAALAHRRLQAGERIVERSGPLVQVPGLEPALDPLQIDLHTQGAAVVEGHRERLGAAHPAQAGGHHEAPAQRPVEALAGDRRERLVGALEDALGADVDPRPRGHLAVHHQAGGVELAEVLPGRPARNEVGVRDQHARGHGVGLEHGYGLAGLDEQRLVVAEPRELELDRRERLGVARRLADPAVHDQIRRSLGDIGMQVVLEHPQRGLLLPATAPQRLRHRPLPPRSCG